MKAFSLTVAASLLLLACGSSEPSLSPLPPGESECGCYLGRTSAADAVVLVRGGVDEAIVMVDGRVHTLKLQPPASVDWWDGDSPAVRAIYSDDSVALQLELEPMPESCPESACEQTSMKGEISVTIGGATHAMNVRGYCGC